MATKARQQYFADETSLQKQRREFSIADSVQQKIDSVETGAQVNVIETVKVNGTALVPDANKAVDVTVPLVIDSLSSASTTDALSAKQGKVLYDYIQNIASRGRFLSNWDCATGLPITDPTENPYPYMAGDYYTVSNVAAAGGTNYRPDGSSYISRQASTTVETDNVVVSDMYLYDGTNWLLLSNRQIAVDTSLSTTSTNPVENRVITNALNGKQDTLTAGSHIDITNNVVSTTGLQEELTAGNNITIEDDCTTESDMKGPCPSGFHVPLQTERETIKNVWTTLGGGASDGPNFGVALKLPMMGQLSDSDASKVYFETSGMYWGAQKTNRTGLSYLSNIIQFHSSGIYPESYAGRAKGMPIRPFKNTPVIPDNSWAMLYGVSISAGGIFWNSTEGLISLSGDGSTWITIADKNLGATTVWNNGNTLTADNCGGYFQWGNNYMFPFTGPTFMSPTQVDVTGYGPGNYYYSSAFIYGVNDWSSVTNHNLWGGQTQSTHQECIYNVISATDTTYTASDFDIKDLTDSTGLRTTWSGKQDALTAGSHIDITSDVISTTGLQEELTAGDNITIEDVCTTESDMQGPAPDGFHVPLNTEWQAVYDIWTALGGGSSDGANFGIALKLPFAGNRSRSNAGVYSQGTIGYYWSSSRNDTDNAYYLNFNSTALGPQRTYLRANGHSVRCFKNSPTIPTSSWTKLYGTSIEAGGIFWSLTDGLISLSSDGQTWVTIADKNLGATTVWNSGDTLSEANCGKYYQWGNNYGFPFTGTVTTSSTQVDASNYGPGNYYSSDTFIIYTGRWDSTDNGNLWGGVTQGTWQECIYNVISATDTTYTAGTGISIDANNEISNTGVISTNNTYDNIIYLSQSDYDNLQNKDANTLYCTPSADVLTFVDTSGYSSGWDGDTQHAPSRDAVYDKIDAMDTTISAKANSVDVLEKTNTTLYTPTADYHPATKLYADTHGPAIPVYSYHGDFSSSISCDVAVGGTYKITVTGYHGGTINRDITITVDNTQVASYTSTVIETFCYQTVVTAAGGTGSTIVIGKSSNTSFTVYDVYIEKIDIQTGYITATVS